MKKTRLTLILCVLLIGAFAPTIVRYIEVWYRLSRLKAIQDAPLIIDDSGFAIDRTVEDAMVQRLRLVRLGVMFSNSYRFGTLQTRDQMLEVASRMQSEFPNSYWEIGPEQTIMIIDFNDKKNAWQNFAEKSSLILTER